MQYALDLVNVSAGYRPGATVLCDLTLAIAQGEMVAVLGPNGAGKSTLLRVLTGLVPAASGEVRLLGKDLRSLPATQRARLVAVVPQELDTPMPFTVVEMVAMGRTAALSRWSRLTKQDHAVIERAMVYTDVIDLRNRPFQELSGGEKQRTAVALALAQEPQIILMDEPTSHLDINHRLEVMQIVERLNAEQNLTALMTSHDLNLAAEFFRRLVVLDRGRLVADGKPAEVLREDLLREVYQCEMRVQADDYTGGVIVTPARRLAPRAHGGGLRLHLVAGGGCGEELMRRLSLAGCAISCGVLNQQDTDAQAAEALGCEVALEKPFSPISAEALARGKALARKTQALVVCEIPFGPGNLANLELAEQALADGMPVYFNVRNLSQRDFTPRREALPRAEALLTRGARPWQHAGELVGELLRIGG